MPVFADLANPESLIYRFGRFEVDEARYSFKIDGNPVPLGGKPWALLLLLLQHAPKTVSRNEIFDRVWRGRVVTDGVLRQAVSRLRIALADSDQRLLRTMHGVGFALTAKVERLASLVIADDVAMVKRDSKLRGHEDWQLLEPLTIGGHAAVWVGEHRSTHERHLFKFARDSTSLTVLKRELAVSRLMEESAVSGLLPVLDWELSCAPYFIEQNFIEGSTMDAWCCAAERPLAERIALLAALANTLAAVHEAGIVHADIKPRNVLVQEHADAAPECYLIDFGSAAVLDIARLRTLNLSLPASVVDSSTGGSLFYMAPEVLAGSDVTIASDLYALGVLLYQVLTLRFDQPIGPNWESEIASEALRADIRALCQLDPNKRPLSAAYVAQNLLSLDERSAALQQHRATEQKLVQFKALSAKRRLYGWAALVLVMASAIAGWGWYQSAQHKQAADLATTEANSLAYYLLDLVMLSVDPMVGGTKDVTVLQALAQMEASVDRDLADQPAVRARVLERLAITYSSLNDLERSNHISKRALADETLKLSDDQRNNMQFNLAENLRKQGRNIEALLLFETLASSSSWMQGINNAATNLTLASIHMQLGNYQSSFEYAQKAAQIKDIAPEVVYAIANGCDQLSAIALANLGRIDEAQRFLDSVAARAKQGHDPSRLWQRGQAAFYALKNDMPQAIAWQFTAIEGMRPSMADSMQFKYAELELANYLFSAGKISKAKEYSAALLADNATGPNLISVRGSANLLMARILLAEGKPVSALPFLSVAKRLIVAANSEQSAGYRSWQQVAEELGKNK